MLSIALLKFLSSRTHQKLVKKFFCLKRVIYFVRVFEEPRKKLPTIKSLDSYVALTVIRVAYRAGAVARHHNVCELIEFKIVKVHFFTVLFCLFDCLFV